jgi:hypothetical protein
MRVYVPLVLCIASRIWVEFLPTSESERGRSPRSPDKVEHAGVGKEGHGRTVDRDLLFLALAFQPSIV